MDQKVQNYKETWGWSWIATSPLWVILKIRLHSGINSTIYVKKGNITHLEHISQDIPITDPRYPIPNPLPFIKCKEYGGTQVVDDKFVLVLFSILSGYAGWHAFAYQNSTTAFIIKNVLMIPIKCMEK